MGLVYLFLRSGHLHSPARRPGGWFCRARGLPTCCSHPPARCPCRAGAQVFPAGQAGKAVSWAELAGYEEQKSVIEDTLLLALQRPDVYEQIARKTRAKFASNRPRAVLFEGPPGTGKTTSGRIIANQVCPSGFNQSGRTVAQLAASLLPAGIIRPCCSVIPFYVVSWKPPRAKVAGRTGSPS